MLPPEKEDPLDIEVLLRIVILGLRWRWSDCILDRSWTDAVGSRSILRVCRV